MKKSILIFVCIFSTLISKSQDSLVVLIRPALNLPVASYDALTFEQVPQTPDSAPKKNMYISTNTPVVYRHTVYIIRFYDWKIKKLLQIGTLYSKLNVTVAVNGTTYPIILDPSTSKMTDLNIDFGKILDGSEIPQSSSVNITVNIKDTNYIVVNNILNTKYYNPKQHYQSLGQDLGGFWLPTLLYSTNFKSTNSGIPFATLPIGVGYGWKFYNNSTKANYIGVSGMFNWLIYSQPTNSTTTSSFNLQALTVGFLVDFNDVISIGYAYGKNFESGGGDAGNMFVLGFGSKLLSFFKQSKSTNTSETFDIKTLGN